MSHYKKIHTRRAFLYTIILLPWLASCGRKVSLDPKPVRWDKDACARCGMKMSDPFHSAQIINPDTGNALLFDDIGCAFLWLIENNSAWKDRALVYFTDGQDGQWIKQEEAFFATPYITPMSFGVSAFSKKENISSEKTILTAEEAKNFIVKFRDEKRRVNAPAVKPERSL